MDKRLVLGLDIGITSVGWGIIDLTTGDIVDKGVRLFPEGTAAENVKRRQQRGARRLLRRRKQRINDLKDLLIKNGIINKDFVPLENPYKIRCKGLTGKLANDELATALLHIAKRRGSFIEFDKIEKDKSYTFEDYKTVIKNAGEVAGVVEDDEEKAKENIATKAVLDQNSRLLKKYNMHICELQLIRLKENGKIRANQNNFKVTQYLSELLAILNNQDLFDDLKTEIIKIIIRKREYYEGPGSYKSPTPYGRFVLENGKIKQYDLIDKMRGKCTLFPDEPRAPKMSYTADLFNFLNDLNNLNIDGKKVTTKQKKEIIEKFINDKGEITPKKLCSYLNVDEALVSGFRIDGEKNLLTKFEGYKKIKKVVTDKEQPLSSVIIENKQYVDAIIEILTKRKGLKERAEEIKKINNDVFDDFTAQKLASISGVTQYHALSLKAIELMLPFLWDTNDNQMQIITKLHLMKGKKEQLKGAKNIPFDDQIIQSPVAKRAQNEAIKVVNAIRKKYGELDTIVIEMARDRNSAEEKKRINDAIRYFTKLNEDAKKIAGNIPLNAKLVQKIRFYQEQDCKCLYTGKPIDLHLMLIDPKAYEIDHIIPISISLDDSINNKVLVYADSNLAKGNMTPFKYFTSGRATGWNFEEYKDYVIRLYNNKSISKKKLFHLLYQEDINKFDVQKKFIQRNLVDTRYASRVILNTLQDYFKANEIDTKVHTVRGSITNIFRRKAQLTKNRDNYYHHIVDALIVASIKKLDYMNHFFDIALSKDDTVYDKKTGEIITVLNEHQFFPPEFINFLTKLRTINDATDYIDVNISHKVDRKVNRQFTDQTIYGARKIDDTYWRIGKHKDIYGEDGKKLAEDIKKGDIDKYFMKQHDPETFELLQKIVETTPVTKGENPFAKFKEEYGYIRKRSKKGNGPIVKSLKYMSNIINNYVDITHKYKVKNDKIKIVLLSITTYRIDIYQSVKSGLYKIAVIRYHNLKNHKNDYYIDKGFYNAEKINKQITADYEFQFSLHKHDIIKLEHKTNKLYNQFFRFIGVNVEQKNILEFKYLHCDPMRDKDRIKIGISKNVLDIQKFHVDILGNLHKVSKEVLQLRL